MSEIENRISEVYISAQAKNQMFANGEFFYHPNGSYSAVGKVYIEALYIKPKGEEEIVPQAEVHIKYSPHKGKEIEFIIDPNDLSKIGIKQEPRKGLMGKFVKPKTEADSKDLEFLNHLLMYSHPSPEFSQELERGKQRVEIADRQIVSFNRVIDEAEKRRKKEEYEEEKAERTAREFIGELTADDACLGIVVDDYLPKYEGRDGLLSDYKKANIESNIHFCLLMESGEAVRVISHVQKQLKESGSDVPVIVFMDGMMRECVYTTGIQTTRALKARLDKAGLPMPYLVGNSNDREHNSILKNENPEHYLTSFHYGDPGWKAIAELLNK